MIENMSWKAIFPPEVKKIEVTIIPQDVKDRMSQVTTRDLYLWGKKNGVIKRLPRKIKKRLYYGSSKKFESKATIACINLWNEYDK